MKKVAGGETTVYVNRYFEKNTATNTVTKYYYHGGMLVALNKGGILQYVSQDHLTGTSLTTDISGNQVAKTTYLPFGGTQTSSGTLSIDHKFTGQRLDGTGLSFFQAAQLKAESSELKTATLTAFQFYNGRLYDSTIGRFI